MNDGTSENRVVLAELADAATELGVALAMIGDEPGLRVLAPADGPSELLAALARADGSAGVYATAMPCPSPIADASLIAFVLCPAVFASEVFAEACAAAEIDPERAAETLDRFVVTSGADAPRLLRGFEMLVERSGFAAEAELAADELADSLGKAFERADVTLTLAAAMHDPSDPLSFISAACEELRQALQLDWAGVVFHARDVLPKALRMSPKFAACSGVEPREAERAATAVLAAADLESGPSVGAFAPPFAAQHGVALVQPLEIDRVAVGALVAGRNDADLMSIDSYHLTLAESVCAFLGPFIDNLRLRESEQRAFFATLEALSSTLDAKDSYTRGHSERVAHLAVAIAEQLKLERADLDRIWIAGRLHDVGKIGVPESVLLKPGGLTDAEFEQIKRHPTIGFEILRGVPGVEPMLPAVLHHHERWDGRGYPAGLAGENIPVDARIMAVADTFDAMSSKRSYRDSLPREVVLAELERSRGSQLDAHMVDAFMRVDLSQYDRMAANAVAQTKGEIAEDERSKDDGPAEPDDASASRHRDADRPDDVKRAA